MKLTPDDLARLQAKELANTIRKLHAGKTLTAPERALLAQAGAEPAAAPFASGHATSWDELAAALNVEERTLYNFRQKHAPEIHTRTRAPFPKAQRLTMPDGRQVVAQWRAFADEVGELKGRGLNNPECNAIDERQLRLRERLADVARAEHKLAEQTREVLKLTEYQDALRVLIAAFDTSLRQLSSRAATSLTTAVRRTMLDFLTAHLTPKQCEKLAPLLEKTALDHAAIAQLLDDELEAARLALASADFLGEPNDAAHADTPEGACRHAPAHP